MAITATPYGLFKVSLGQKLINLGSDALKLMLCPSSYTPNLDTHQFKSSVTAEVSGTGYTAGGVTLSSVTFTLNTSTDKVTLDADDVPWTGASFTSPRYGVLYDGTPATDATRPLIGLVDFGADQTISGNFTVTWSASGILTY